MRINVITNARFAGSDTDAALAALRRAAAQLGIELAEDATATESDFHLVLGGDGSVLRALQRLDGSAAPLASVNIGTLGFLTCGGSNDLTRILRSLQTGEYKTVVRSMLEAHCVCQGTAQNTRHALNDAVALRSDSGQAVHIALTVDGAPVAEFVCDGMIVATPTGSTAYALSAGGPIIMPDAKTFCVIAICPHSMTARPLILPDSSTVGFRVVKAHSPLSFSLDGQVVSTLEPGDSALIRLSERKANLVMLPDDTPFSVIAQKLRWGTR